MADLEITNTNTIQEIIYESSRLRSLIAEIFKLEIKDISSIRLDSDNYKIDIYTNETYFRLKPKGQEDILLTNPETRILEMHFDPALAQAIYRIINEFSYSANAAN